LLLTAAAACKQDAQDVGQQNISLAQCQSELSSCRAARQATAILATERDDLRVALESVTRELVEVKVDRDKMAVELKAYRRRNAPGDIQE
jgi:septal ring factor EnvC (AmiA/AmiB activator)